MIPHTYLTKQTDPEAITVLNQTYDSYTGFKATQMGCVYITFLRLMSSSFCLILARSFEACLMFYHKRRLQNTQDGNLVKVF